jgi:enoyl-CoA hydratase/carnithine racemase
MSEPAAITRPSVIAQRRGRAGWLTLNRPAALHALDLEMIAHISHALRSWRADPTVHLVVIDSIGERAFCAGGDVRAVRAHSLAGQHDLIEAFFAAEYALNRTIAEYPKPYVALIDGICLGGGIGISVHGDARVVSEHAAMAMPETAIALFPDVGTTHVLPRLPGALGTWLALTGTRLAGADCVHAGLATHFVPRAEQPSLAAALAADGIAALPPRAQPLPPFSHAADRAEIDATFSADTVAEIIARLNASTTPWAATARAALAAASPSSLVWSLALLRAGATRTLPECLAAELAATRTVTRHHDFIEGVRAMVVDKDRRPTWLPATLDAIDPAAIAAILA